MLLWRSIHHCLHFVSRMPSFWKPSRALVTAVFMSADLGKWQRLCLLHLASDVIQACQNLIQKAFYSCSTFFPYLGILKQCLLATVQSIFGIASLCTGWPMERLTLALLWLSRKAAPSSSQEVIWIWGPHHLRRKCTGPWAIRHHVHQHQEGALARANFHLSTVIAIV